MLEFLRYYSRKDIQKALVEQSANKEFGVRYHEAFGKRPDTLQFEADIFEFARKGATSFHISEETWTDPLSLATGLNRAQLDALRKGWDLILDIDCPYWDYSKLTAYLLVEALKFHNLKNISVKFSGNKGFHIGVPFEAFPEEVTGKKIKDLYPEGLRVIAAYLQDMIRPLLVQKILEKEDIDAIFKRTGKKMAELIKNNEFDPFSIIDIDTILISSRHLYRAPYSLHEKTGLSSLPIEPGKIMGFEKDSARPEKVDTKIKFLDRANVTEKEAKELVMQAFDWQSKQTIKQNITEDSKISETKAAETHEMPTIAISSEKFPECIKKILAGKMPDGKKRALFVLLRFLKNVGWSAEDIDKTVREWNKTHDQPLGDSYITTQLVWHKRQKTAILPPNCMSNNYYKDLQICPGGQGCLKYKNPVNYAKVQQKLRAIKEKITKKSKK